MSATEEDPVSLGCSSTDMLAALEADFNDILVSTSPFLQDGFEPFVEDASLPEIERLDNFIKYLEQELNKTKEDIETEFKATQREHSKTVTFLDDLEVEEVDELEDQLRVEQFKEFMQSPLFGKSKNSFEASPYAGRKDELADTPRRVNAYLEALEKKGYTNSHLRRMQDQEEHTATHDFFESALRGEHSPSNNGTLARTTSFSNRSTPAKAPMRIVHEMTPESLRKNWDMEEEDSDGGDVYTEEELDEMYEYNNLTSNNIGTPERKPKKLFSEQDDAVMVESDDVIVEDDDYEEEEEEDDLGEGGAESPPRGSPTRTPKKFSTPLGKNGKDLRLNGDFSVWSTGRMLFTYHLQSEYVGLYSTAVTHVNNDGKLIPLTSISQIAMSNGSDHNASPGSSKLNDLHSGFDQVNPNNVASSPRGFFNVHTVECVIRPDIELKVIMASIVKLAKMTQNKCVILHRSHAVVMPSRSSRPSLSNLFQQGGAAGSGGNSADSSEGGSHSKNNRNANNGMREWDQIDIQICVSRELRQRVILMQFMRRISVFMGSMIINQLSGPLQYVPINKCPATKKLVTSFKKELIGQDICLSSLYRIPAPQVCSLPKGLDSHFSAQLHSLCREIMWQKLRGDFKDMEDHLREQEQEAAIFVKTMEPILKQYGSKIPAPWSRSKFNSITQSSPSMENVLVDRISSMDSIDTPSRKKINFELDVENISKSESTDSIVLVDSSSSSSHHMKTPERVKPSSGDDTLGSLQSIALQSPSSPLTQRYRGLLDKDPEMDGMTYCLLVLEKCYQDLQDNCDIEYMDRVQQRNATTINLVEDMLNYKKKLLQSIVEIPNVKTAALMKTFQQTFQTCVVSTEAQILDKRIRPRDGSHPPANNSSSNSNSNSNSTKTAQVKSWFQGLGESVQQLVGGNNANAAGQQASTVKKSTSSSSFDGDLDLPDGNAKGSFKPKDSRKKLTAGEVEARMKAYNAGDSDIQQKTATVKVTKGSTPEVSFQLNKAVVLYYCASLIANVPGTMYITQHHVCLVSSVLGYYQKTEVFALANLTDLILLSAGSGAASSDQGDGNTGAVTLLAINAMKLVFFNGLRSITVSPMVVDCVRVKAIMELVKLQFLVSKAPLSAK